MVALVCIAMLLSLVLGFLGGQQSMTKDLMKREEELAEAHWLIDSLNKRLLEETGGKILDEDERD